MGYGVWGHGDKSEIFFSINKVYDCTPLLELSLNPIQSKADSIIEILLNGNSIREFMPKSDINSYYFKLDNSIYDKNNTITLKNNFFAFPKKINDDKKALSIKLYYFKLSCT